ncbi:hypothetical protein LIA77_11442 [Sarocladium implicatum]|nr:hypothetical protein LIA77_11442 [Sarocladium implicatum]
MTLDLTPVRCITSLVVGVHLRGKCGVSGSVDKVHALIFHWRGSQNYSTMVYSSILTCLGDLHQSTNDFIRPR